MRTPTADWGGQHTVRAQGNQTFAIDMNDPAFNGAQGVKISIASARPRPGEYMNLMLRDKNGNVVKQQNSGGQGSGMGEISADGLPPDQGPYTLDVDTNMQDYHIQRNPRAQAVVGGELDPSYRPGAPANPPVNPNPTPSTVNTVSGGGNEPAPNRAGTTGISNPGAATADVAGSGRGSQANEPITDLNAAPVRAITDLNAAPVRGAAPLNNWFPSNPAFQAGRGQIETGTPVNAVTNALLRRYMRPRM